MISEARDGGRRAGVPNAQLIVVATTRELLLVKRPFEATDFLAMARQLAHRACVRTHIAEEDHAIAGARGEGLRVPRHRPDARSVPESNESSTEQRVKL